MLFHEMRSNNGGIDYEQTMTIGCPFALTRLLITFSSPSPWFLSKVSNVVLNVVPTTVPTNLRMKGNMRCYVPSTYFLKNMILSREHLCNYVQRYYAYLHHVSWLISDDVSSNCTSYGWSINQAQQRTIGLYRYKSVSHEHDNDNKSDDRSKPSIALELGSCSSSL